jgi:hypothetical protein
MDQATRKDLRRDSLSNDAVAIQEVFQFPDGYIIVVINFLFFTSSPSPSSSG